MDRPEIQYDRRQIKVWTRIERRMFRIEDV